MLAKRKMRSNELAERNARRGIFWSIEPMNQLIKASRI